MATTAASTSGRTLPERWARASKVPSAGFTGWPGRFATISASSPARAILSVTSPPRVRSPTIPVKTSKNARPARRDRVGRRVVALCGEDGLRRDKDPLSISHGIGA
ncbi:hypothetical protein Val02_08360 [Virgisporangium aliadipatigenens]|uniref:Uncharacterized protein n=1 Tax=Virgisporangium aliadipatigenens TaxID=741659 RepID=A0A8J3YH81_9ACTN|nr:hypothetical protein Val02_08360 [Virgisporangium aliadipatigenens]